MSSLGDASSWRLYTWATPWVDFDLPVVDFDLDLVNALIRDGTILVVKKNLVRKKKGEKMKECIL